MKKIVPSSSLLILTTALAFGTLGGCAASGSAASGAPAGPLVLDGAQYKMLAASGSLDGRVVEFLQRGKGLMGCLVAPGNKLRNVAGVDNGSWIFSLQEKGPNEYEGVYRAIGADGGINEKQVAVNFHDDVLGWNLETATWERQSGASQLTPDEKSRCTKR